MPLVSLAEAEPPLKNVSICRKAGGFPQCAAAKPPNTAPGVTFQIHRRTCEPERPLSDCHERRLAIGMPQSQIEFGGHVAIARRKSFEIEQLVIEQMRRDHVSQRVEHRSAHVWNLLLEFGNQFLDARTFQVWLRSAQVAGNDRELLLGGKFSDITLAAIGQRTNDGVPSIVRTQHWRHRFERSDIKKIQ